MDNESVAISTGVSLRDDLRFQIFNFAGDYYLPFFNYYEQDSHLHFLSSSEAESRVQIRVGHESLCGRVASCVFKLGDCDSVIE